jgi:hypothetical protein
MAGKRFEVGLLDEVLAADISKLGGATTFPALARGSAIALELVLGQVLLCHIMQNE